MEFYYDALDRGCKSIIGAIYESQNLIIRVKSSGINYCRLILRYDEEDECAYEMQRDSDGFFICLEGLRVGIIWYCFEVDDKRYYDDGCCVATQNSDKWFQLSVCKNRIQLNKSQAIIMYQIMPDRFSKADGYGNSYGKRMRNWGEQPEYLPDKNGKILNNDFFGGNFEGIRQKLPYLKSLGVNVIYLNPIFKANSNHRYDTGDYFMLDPLLGNEEDFLRLVTDCKKSNICIILDGVFNHTGDDSRYFNKYNHYDSLGAYQSKKSPYYNWYIFDEYPDKYKSWWGIDILPTINKNCVEFENFIVGDSGVIDRYMKLGIGGFRLDVVDELPDGFVEKIFGKIKSFGREKLVIGEVWEDASNKIAYGIRRTYFTEKELDGVMNYPLKNAIINFVISGRGEELYSVIRNQINNFTKNSLDSMMNILGTHDTPRILTVLGKAGKLAGTREDMAKEKLSKEEFGIAIKRLKCAVVLQFTLYGFPSIYYGDEIGMEGNKDPFNRACFDFEKCNSEIYEFYKAISSLRTKYSCFCSGDLKFLNYKQGVISYERVDKNGVALIAINCGDRAINIKLKGKCKEIMRNIKCDKITLNMYDFAMFYKSNILPCDD